MNSEPSGASILLNKALKAAANKDKVLALNLLQQLVSTYPGHARGHNELGVMYYQGGQGDKARSHFEQAVSIDPAFARALINLGACHNDRGDNSSAIRCYQEAIAINPLLADAWANLGKLWNEIREFESSAYCFQRALTLDRRPNFLRGLAMAYRQSGRLTRAKSLLKEALALDPADAIAHFGLAPIHFYLEEYEDALKEYEWRWQLAKMREHKHSYPQIFSKPAYAGQDLRNKTLLLHTEQGFGDSLLFARFIETVRPHVNHLAMWCWPGLVKLFKENFPLDDVTGDATRLPAFDYHLPLLSVPLHFDPKLESIDKFSPYIKTGENGRDASGIDPTKLNVGLVWGCDNNGFDYAYKRIALDELSPLVATPNTCWHSLQVGPERRELAEHPLKSGIIDRGGTLGNFRETARAIHDLDLIISVDTAVAHLAGAMGKPLWVLLKKNPDWRWHGHGDHPLWYPRAKSYQQYAHGDWRHAIKRMGKDLAFLAKNLIRKQ